MRSSTESYVTLLYMFGNCIKILRNPLFANCNTAQYNVFWQLGTGTVMTKEATLPIFHVQIRYLSPINYLK
jgi:hypothetical protein